MLVNEIKNVLRNKNNLIYIITFIIVFIILNISLNIKNIIDQYYDSKINGYIESIYKEYEQSNEEEKIDINFEELFRTVQTSNGQELTNEQRQKIKNMKHVKEIKSETININANTIIINYIVLDDWKNCAEVQKYLDIQGIGNYVDTMGIDENLLNNYNILKNFSNILKFIIIIIVVIALIMCCRNIMKNEVKNFELLKTFGYTNRKIKSIVFAQVLVLVIIGTVLGYIIYELISFIIINNVLKMSLDANVIDNIIINLIIILISITATVESTKIK